MKGADEFTNSAGDGNEQMFVSILAACPVGLCRVEERTFKWVNHAMVKMFGHRCEDDFVGNSTRMIYASERDFERTGAVLYDGRSGLTELETDAALVRKDGTTFHGHLRTSALDPSNLIRGSIVAVTDRTPIKKAEAAVLESERRFREILQHLRLIAVCFDMDGKITYCNDFLLEMTGRAREEVLGENWFDTFVSSGAESPANRWYSPSGQGLMRSGKETYLLTKDGEQRCIRWNSTLFLRDPHRNPFGLACIGEDITERKQANALLLHTERLKAVGEMAGAVAHNFNNILQAIVGASQLAGYHLELGTIPRAVAGLDRILRTCERGAQTVKRLQEFSRIRKEGCVSDFKEFDLSFILREAVEMARPWWKTNPEREGIVISLTMDLETRSFVNGKENELFEVAINLIKNAAEACPEGGTIRVRVFSQEGHVIFQVQDNGVGIDKSDLVKVFQPFWTTKGYRGTGMGLCSSHAIISRHGGAISVTSPDNGGTTVTVTLPKARGGVSAPKEHSTEISSIPLRVLLVDDMEDLLSTLAEGLESRGQTVIPATSGGEAIAIFNRESVDTVICDLGMEAMNGWEVGAAIKAICLEKGIPKIPFILLTGWDEQIADPSYMHRSGVTRILRKPISLDELVQVVEEGVEEVVDEGRSIWMPVIGNGCQER